MKSFPRTLINVCRSGCCTEGPRVRETEGPAGQVWAVSLTVLNTQAEQSRWTGGLGVSVLQPNPSQASEVRLNSLSGKMLRCSLCVMLARKAKKTGNSGGPGQAWDASYLCPTLLI